MSDKQNVFNFGCIFLVLASWVVIGCGCYVVMKIIHRNNQEVTP